MNDHITPWRLVEMDPPTIEQATEISRYLQGQLPGNRLVERDGMTKWKLCDNEAHPGIASAIVAGPTGRFVSMCTVTPKRLWRNGIEQPWAEIGDTFTDVAYLRKHKVTLRARSEPHQSPMNDVVYPRKGPFETLVNASRSRAQAAEIGIIYGLPNDKSLPGYVKKLDFFVKEDLILENYVAILSTRSLGVRSSASRIPVLRSLLCNPFVVRSSRRLAKLVLSFVSTQRREIVIEKVQSFGPEFDSLWQRVREKLPNAQVRDARYLAWRYNKNPFSFDVFTAKKEDELLGYLVMLTVHHDGDNAFSHSILIDWLYDTGSVSSSPKALLSAAIRHAIEQEADVISAVISRGSPLLLPFSSIGFIRRKRKMPVIFNGNHEGRSILTDPSPWHFTLSDTDSF